MPAHTHVASIIGSEQGVDYVQRHMPHATTSLWCAAVDEELTSRSYIVPGIGDAGDLAYGESCNRRCPRTDGRRSAPPPSASGFVGED